MAGYLRKNNKKILAVLGVFLMIAFIVPTVTKNQMRGGNPAERVGMARGRALTQADVYRAQNDLDTLNRHTTIMAMDLAELIDPANSPMNRFDTSPREQAGRLAMRIVRDMDATTFALLLREAQAMGVRASEDLLEYRMNDIFQGVNAPSPDMREAFDYALRDWLTILAAFDRVADAAKVSPASVEHLMADRMEQMALSMIEFKAEQFTKAVPPPTDPQLQEFFKKHQNEDPDQDEFGIGYRFPNRLRLEWIMIPYAEIRKQVTSDEAYDYFEKHQAEFIATTMPATQPSTKPAATQAAASQPVKYQRKWALGNDVDKEIRDKLAEQRVGEIAKYIQQIYAGDFSAYRQAAKEAKSATPANAPPTAVGPAFFSPAYTVQLARRVQEQKKEAGGVRPSTVDDGQLRSEKDLTSNPPFSAVFIPTNTGGTFPAATYFFTRYGSFLSPEIRKELQDNGESILSRYQATQVPLRDKDHNFYVVRVVEDSAAHAAESIQAAGADRVKKDYINVQAYQKAKEAAQKLLDKARKDGFDAAAKADPDRQLIKTELFSGMVPTIKFSQGQLPETAFARLHDGGLSLVQERVKTGQEHPTGLIELPKQLAVAAAQLTDAKPASEATVGMFATFTRPQQRIQRLAAMLGQWFDPKNVAQRMQFIPEKKENQKAPSEGPGPQEPMQIGT